MTIPGVQKPHWLAPHPPIASAHTSAGSADARRIWCVRADRAEQGTARTPAVARSGDLVVAVNAGGDPRRAVDENGAAPALPLRSAPVLDRSNPEFLSECIEQRARPLDLNVGAVQLESHAAHPRSRFAG